MEILYIPLKTAKNNLLNGTILYTPSLVEKNSHFLIFHHLKKIKNFYTQIIVGF